MFGSKEYRLRFTKQAEELVDRMTLKEKVALLSGDTSLEQMLENNKTPGRHYNDEPYPAGGSERLGIPKLRFCDGPRGVVCGTGKHTCFPVPLLRAATFDEGLERRIGEALALETLEEGGNLFGGVCVNLAYHPGWGRSQDSYGEDSFLIGKMGAALVKGVQEKGVIACVKHFAFNSMELSRFRVDIECEKQAEQEVFLPHFKACIDAGAACVMAAYNRYQGEYCCENHYLLTEVLKEQWGFDGFTISDFFWGLHSTEKAMNGGLDVEMCGTKYYGQKLQDAVAEGLVSETAVNCAAVRVVRTLLAWKEAQKGKPQKPDAEAPISLALECARKGITLLKNNGVLPLKKEKIQKILIAGELAAEGNTGDHGSGRAYPPYTVSPLLGIRRFLSGKAEVVYLDGSDEDLLIKTAQECDAAVVVAGNRYDEEGERISEAAADNFTMSSGGDRVNSLGLKEKEKKLLALVGSHQKNTVAVLVGGMIVMDGWLDKVGALLQFYYAGMEGGSALAEILFGKACPSGKLPFSIPQRECDLPSIRWETDRQRYGYYHGYKKLEKEGESPAFPFGFGLSYTCFRYSSPTFSADSDKITAQCTVKNEGDVAGEEIVQLYIGFRNSKKRLSPVKALKGFQRVALSPNEEKRVEISCPLDSLKRFQENSGQWELEKIDYIVSIGSSSNPADLLTGTVSVK